MDLGLGNQRMTLGRGIQSKEARIRPVASKEYRCNSFTAAACEVRNGFKKSPSSDFKIIAAVRQCKMVWQRSMAKWSRSTGLRSFLRAIVEIQTSLTLIRSPGNITCNNKKIPYPRLPQQKGKIEDP